MASLLVSLRSIYLRLLALSLSCIATGLLFLGTSAQPEAVAAFDPTFRSQLQTQGRGEYIVLLKEQADLRPAYAIADWKERGHFVIHALRTTAARSQAPVMQLLARQQAAGDVSSFRPLTIVNGFLVTSGVATFDLLVQQRQIIRLDLDPALPQPEPLRNPLLTPAQVDELEWGVARLGADAIWRDFGVRGEGVVVANIDSGVDYLHPALVNSYRGNLGNGLFDHNTNWFDPFLPEHFAPTPYDWHGTHTLGTMVGDGGADGPIGIAPAARWIAATGSTSVGGALLSAEWLLAPYPLQQGAEQGDPDLRPHIINNSWNIRGSGDFTYVQAIAAWRAAGIIPIFSAGNFGYSPRTISSPADDCNVLAIGAVDNNDVVAYFSGKGPGFFQDCLDKPDFTAPGVNVRSAIPGGYYALDGTSMAAPHVAGCAALLLSLKPELSYDELYDLLQQSAVDLGSPGYDSGYGYGRIDCYAAAAAATFLHLTPSHADLCIDQPPTHVTVRVVEPETQPPPVTLTVLAAPLDKPFITLGAGQVTPTRGALVTTTLTISVAPGALAGTYPVSVVGNNGSRIHTSTVTIGIYANAPTAPLLQSPGNGAVNMGRKPLFTWAVSLATHVLLEVASDPAFANLVYTHTVSGESHSILTPLDFDTRYYWRVTPSNPCGLGLPSATNTFVAETHILHVDQAATGAANGATWHDAFRDLSSALVIAQNRSEIWVAAGRYSPGPAPDATFVLNDGVQLYGGFQGHEQKRSERTADPAINQTTLDGGGVNNHVVSGIYLSVTTTLDGFTITGGNAVSRTMSGAAAGGGLYLVRSSPQLRNLYITQNQTVGAGGGAFIVNGMPRLNHVTFAHNRAQDGGGLYCYCQDAVLHDLVVFQNRAENLGGGLILWGDSNTLVNAVIAGNRAYAAGGATLHNLLLVNAVVVGNQADTLGGGLWSTGASPQVSQVSIIGNQAGQGGSGIYHHAYSYLSPYRLANAILWQNGTSQFQIEGQAGMLIENSLFRGACPIHAVCSGNQITADPRLTRKPSWGADETWGTEDDDYGDLRLLATSPALDAGANAAVPIDLTDIDDDGDMAEPLPLDLAWAARFVDVAAVDTGSGTPPLVDLGAYEAAFTPENTPVPTAIPTASPTSFSTFTPTPAPTSSPVATMIPTATQLPTGVDLYFPRVSNQK